MPEFGFDDQERLERMTATYYLDGSCAVGSAAFADLAEQADVLGRLHEDAAEHFRQRATFWRGIARNSD